MPNISYKSFVGNQRLYGYPRAKIGRNGYYPDERFLTYALCKVRIDNLDPLLLSDSLTLSHLKRFSTNFIPNPSFILKDIDLQAFNIQTSTGGVTRRGALITPQHYLGVKHAAPAIGTIASFMKSDNTIITRTIIDVQKQNENPTFSPSPDLCVGLLDSPILDFEPVRLLNAPSEMTIDISAYIPNNEISDSEIDNPLSFIETKKYSIEGTLYDMNSLWYYNRKNEISIIGQKFPYLNKNYPDNPFLKTETNLGNFTNPVRDLVENYVFGDSGSPIFFLFNGKIYLHMLLSTDAGGGTAIRYSFDILTDMIDIINTRNNVNPSYNIIASNGDFDESVLNLTYIKP